MKYLNEFLNEAKLSADDRELLDTLIADFKTATDPQRYDYVDDYDEYEDDLPSGGEVLGMIRHYFGEKVAKQVEDGEYAFHFGRDYKPHYDSKDWYIKNNSFNKDGKMNKNSIKKMKNYYKRKKRHGGSTY
jgi:hypothetical protein